MTTVKTIALTMGEPGGIGPEIALKAVAALSGTQGFVPLLVGDPEVWREAAELLAPTLPFRLSELEIVPAGQASGYQKGAPTAEGGRASAEAIRQAVQLCLSGRASGMVTAPISKEALKKAGLPWPGHTEMLAELTGTSKYAMVLMGGGLRVLLCTIHCALSEVPSLITRPALLVAIEMASRACRMLGLTYAPRIAVAGLNPHAGEGGMFGAEEEHVIAPAIREASAMGYGEVTGPWPADTVFHRAVKGDFDIVVSMYHDQGLGPLKLLAFDTGVNMTVGLPIIRTSPDHGTAYDIAWRGEAKASSMVEAVKAALSLKLQGS